MYTFRPPPLLIAALILIIPIFSSHVSATSSHLTNYTENLTLQPLPRNTLLTTFTFESYSIPSTDPHGTSPEYSVFPRSLGQILEQSKTQELHLRFSQGWWDAENWGSPPNQGKYAGGLGVELWAWVEGETLTEAKANWRKLVYTLSGLFCASLNFIDDATTTFPVKSFQPFGLVNDTRGGNLHLLRGVLPREPVCTENLTPFIKLLPCKGKAGISSLLDGHKIFDAQWQGMAIDVSVECDNNGVCRKKMTQTINAVIDVSRSISRRTSPVPLPTAFDKLRCDTTKPYSSQFHCFPLKEDTNVDWLLSDIFGRQIQGSCPLAENQEHISIKTSDNWDTAFISGNTGSDDTTTPMLLVEGRDFKLEQGIPTNIRFTSPNSSNIVDLPQQPVLVERSFTGYGLERGGIRTTFTNPSTKDSVRFVYFETFPWYMRLFLHTLDIQIRSFAISETNYSSANILQDIYYLPAIDRKQPSQLEIDIDLPPATSASLSYEFDKAHLFIEEYPPDANHGFDIAPGVLTTLNDNEEFQYTIRTTSLLLQLPTPDFSMPYNVIILTGTVMALTFGNIFNLLTKRIVTEEEAEEIANEKPITKFISKIKGLIEKKTIGNQSALYQEEESEQVE